MAEKTTVQQIAVVDTENCSACGTCEAACPNQAIKVDDTAVVDAEKCDGCGTCTSECPTEAISLKDKE